MRTLRSTADPNVGTTSTTSNALTQARLDGDNARKTSLNTR